MKNINQLKDFVEYQLKVNNIRSGYNKFSKHGYVSFDKDNKTVHLDYYADLKIYSILDIDNKDGSEYEERFGNIKPLLQYLLKNY